MQSPENNISAEAIRRGDDEAFTRIYSEVVPQLLDLAEAYVGSAADAEEIVQDVICNMWENRAAFLPTGNVTHYLIRAVRNRAFNLLKQRNAATRLIDSFTDEQDTLPLLDEGSEQDGSESPLDGIGIARAAEYPEAFWNAYEHALEQLPEKCRDVYLLHQTGHLTYTEIANLLGISVHTVHGHMTRALKLLRQALQGWRP